MIRIWMVFGLLVVAACATKKQASTDVAKQQEVTLDSPQKAILGEVPKNNPATTINRVTIDGNILTLNVSYSGGCEQQYFDLVGMKPIMKSLPPKRSVVLVRNDRGDVCREWITEDLQFDLTALAYQQIAGAEIILILEGYDEHISYVYP